MTTASTDREPAARVDVREAHPHHRGHDGPWTAMSVEAVAAALGTSLTTGLDADQVASRIARHGRNVLREGRRRGPVRMLIAQFADLMVLVLIGAAVVAGFVGEPEDIATIAVIVILNAVLGFVQEYRAERAMAALRRIAAPVARVRRGGREEDVEASGLVPGDIVLLEGGNVVPADLRLTAAARLTLDESALTGESVPVVKSTSAAGGHESMLTVGDRRNMAFLGTTVSSGRGTGVVVETGMRTELGRIARLLAGTEETRTPLQKRLAGFGQQLAVVVLAICAVIFAAGLLRGERPVLMLMTALSLAVAAIPEALPAVATLSLAFGARKLARQHALIRRLPAVETLGSVTYIFTDKTGTLTQNRMHVEEVRVPDGAAITLGTGSDAHGLLARALVLCNDAEIAGEAQRGDPTELALIVAAIAAGVERAACIAALPRVAELPFSAERGRMTTVHRDGAAFVAFTKGAPERVIESCATAREGDDARPLDRARALAVAEAMAARGLRVLAVATRRLGAVPAALDEAEGDATLLGFVGLMDPPRPEAREAVALCQTAGIRVVMITGDHPATARAIAGRLGILNGDGEDEVVTGAELHALSPSQLAERAGRVRVYARVAPEDKIRIVRALQETGELVAMTGDGVNDAPALRRADIGIAMGRSGTDVAREAAPLVLLDDNFATIVGAVREGRRIYDNIRRFVRYVLTGNSAEIWVLLLAPFVGLPLPLLPIHILWVNLVTDGLPGLALTAEPAERTVMQRSPRPPTESIFAQGLWQHAVRFGLLMGGGTLAIQAWALHAGMAEWRSMTFTVLTLSQMGHVLAIRSERESLFTMGLRGNLPLLGTVLATLALQLATLYLPPLRALLRTEALSAGELGLCLAASSLVVVGVEIEKWLIRRGGRPR